MNKHIVFAVSIEDARAAIAQLGLEFDETIWVMNIQLLGSADYTGYKAVFTEAFTSTPAFVDAAAAYGDPRKEVA